MDGKICEQTVFLNGPQGFASEPTSRLPGWFLFVDAGATFSCLFLSFSISWRRRGGARRIP
jgi:hypothetical protein